MKPSFNLAWRLSWFETHLYSWRAYSRHQDATSQHRAACCRKALEDGAATTRELTDRLQIVSAFLATARARHHGAKDG